MPPFEHEKAEAVELSESPEKVLEEEEEEEETATTEGAKNTKNRQKMNSIDEHRTMSHSELVAHFFDDPSELELEAIQHDEHCQELAHNLRRNRQTSWNSFVHRTARRTHLAGGRRLDDDEPPTLLSEQDAKRSQVHFKHDDLLTVVHEFERIPANLKPQLWLTPADFSRFDTDVEVTMFRWENHLSGKITFDEERNCLRGLEEHISIGAIISMYPHQERRTGHRRRHRINVIAELERQKTVNGTDAVWNVELLRHASLKESVQSADAAISLGQADQAERERIWDDDNNDNNNNSSPAQQANASSTPEQAKSSGKKKKMKKKLFRFFSGKKKTASSD